MYKDQAYQQQVEADIEALRDVQKKWREEKRQQEIQPLAIDRIRIKKSDLYSDKPDGDNTQSAKISRFKNCLLTGLPRSQLTLILTHSDDAGEYSYRCWSHTPGDSRSLSEKEMINNITTTGIEKGFNGVPWTSVGTPRYHFFFQDISGSDAHSYMLVYRNKLFKYPKDAWLKNAETPHTQVDVPLHIEDNNLPSLKDLVVGLLIVDWE